MGDLMHAFAAFGLGLVFASVVFGGGWLVVGYCRDGVDLGLSLRRRAATSLLITVMYVTVCVLTFVLTSAVGLKWLNW